MNTHIINGKKIAETVRQSLKKTVADLQKNHNLTPGLAVVLIGEDPASQVYVRNKIAQTKEVLMNSFEFKLPAQTPQDEVLALVHTLNKRQDVHGILVQFPVPDHMNQAEIIKAIDPKKDVDGLHIENIGLLTTGDKGLTPCTPSGCVLLLKKTLPSLSGKHAVIVGRSRLVGKPLAMLLLNENCTVTIAHSRTENLPAICQKADILIAAVGKSMMIKKEWVKPGATVIDVGINRMKIPDGKAKLVGDVDFENVSPIAGAITPVPGGVGPMTIACLLRNTVTAACQQNNLPNPLE